MDAREKIIETAMRLFSTQGYSTTSLSQVAKEAQVSKALIFWHFENKESLFRTAVQRTFEPYIINVVDDLEGLSEVDQIKRLIDEYYDFVSKNIYSVKFFLGLMLREEKHPEAGHAAELADLFCRNARRKVRRLFRDLWRNDDVIKYGVGQRVLRGDHVWFEVDTMGALPHGVPSGRAEDLATRR